MLMAVHMIRHDACGANLRDLRGELPPDVRPPHAPREIVPSEGGMVGAETARVIDETWDLLRRQHGAAVDEREVNADAERRRRFRDGDGLSKCRLPRHEARRAQ